MSNPSAPAHDPHRSEHLGAVGEREQRRVVRPRQPGERNGLFVVAHRRHRRRKIHRVETGVEGVRLAAVDRQPHPLVAAEGAPLGQELAPGAVSFQQRRRGGLEIRYFGQGQPFGTAEKRHRHRPLRQPEPGQRLRDLADFSGIGQPAQIRFRLDPVEPQKQRRIRRGGDPIRRRRRQHSDAPKKSDGQRHPSYPFHLPSSLRGRFPLPATSYNSMNRRPFQGAVRRPAILRRRSAVAASGPARRQRRRPNVGFGMSRPPRWAGLIGAAECRFGTRTGRTGRTSRTSRTCRTEKQTTTKRRYKHGGRARRKKARHSAAFWGKGV